MVEKYPEWGPRKEQKYRIFSMKTGKKVCWPDWNQFWRVTVAVPATGSKKTSPSCRAVSLSLELSPSLVTSLSTNTERREELWIPWTTTAEEKEVKLSVFGVNSFIKDYISLYPLMKELIAMMHCNSLLSRDDGEKSYARISLRVSSWSSKISGQTAELPGPSLRQGLPRGGHLLLYRQTLSLPWLVLNTHKNKFMKVLLLSFGHISCIFAVWLRPDWFANI